MAQKKTAAKSATRVTTSPTCRAKERMVQHRLSQGNTRTTRKAERDCCKAFQYNTLHTLPLGFGQRDVLPGSEPCAKESTSVSPGS
jgi:hypothetical protein